MAEVEQRAKIPSKKFNELFTQVVNVVQYSTEKIAVKIFKSKATGRFVAVDTIKTNDKYFSVFINPVDSTENRSILYFEEYQYCFQGFFLIKCKPENYGMLTEQGLWKIPVIDSYFTTEEPADMTGVSEWWPDYKSIHNLAPLRIKHGDLYVMVTFPEGLVFKTPDNVSLFTMIRITSDTRVFVKKPSGECASLISSLDSQYTRFEKNEAILAYSFEQEWETPEDFIERFKEYQGVIKFA